MNFYGSLIFTTGNQLEFRFATFYIKARSINSQVIQIFFTDLNHLHIPIPPSTFHNDFSGLMYNDYNGSFFFDSSRKHEIVSSGVILLQFNQTLIYANKDCLECLARSPSGRIIQNIIKGTDDFLVPRMKRSECDDLVESAKYWD